MRYNDFRILNNDLERVNMNKKVTYSILVIWLFLAIVASIFINAISANGYFVLKDSSFTDIKNIKGYTQENSYFDYLGGEAILEIPAVDKSSKLYIETNDVPLKDVTINVRYRLKNGNISQTSKKQKWKAKEHYILLNVNEKDIDSYILELKHDINISHFYYLHPDTKLINKQKLFLISIPCTLLVAILLALCSITKRILEELKNRIVRMKNKILDNKKKTLKILIFFATSFIFALVLNVVYIHFISNTLSKKVFIFLFYLVFLFDIFILFIKKKIIRIEVLAFLLIFSSGGMIAFSEPTSLGMVWDDETHYKNINMISHVLDNKQSEADIQMLNTFASNAIYHDTYSIDAQRLKNIKLENLYRNNLYRESNDNANKITINNLCYFIPALGLIVARGLNFSYNYVIAFGRFAYVILLSICGYFAIKNLKKAKIVMLLLMLLPTVIMEAGNFNYDTWILSFTLLGASYFIKELESDAKISKNNVYAMIIFVLLGILPKIVYFPLLFIYYFMPKNKFENKRDHYKYLAGITFAIIALIIVLIMNNVILPYLSGQKGEVTGDLRGGDGVNSGKQIKFILTNPLTAIIILIKFLMTYLNTLKMGSQYTTLMAYINFKGEEQWVIQTGNMLIPLMLLISVFNNQPFKYRINGVLKVLSLFLYILIGAICALALYVTFTPVGYSTVLGCQGRYLLPVLFYPIFILGQWFNNIKLNSNFVKHMNILSVVLFLCILNHQWFINYIRI